MFVGKIKLFSFYFHFFIICYFHLLFQTFHFSNTDPNDNTGPYQTVHEEPSETEFDFRHLYRDADHEDDAGPFQSMFRIGRPRPANPDIECNVDEFDEHVYEEDDRDCFEDTFVWADCEVVRQPITNIKTEGVPSF